MSTWFALVAVVTGVWRDVPLIDDWTYAWTVEHLLQTGRFDILDWSSAYPLIQALWGGMWSAALGFSFMSLRISTLVLAVVGCWALYLMLRELGASQRVAVLGALTMAVNPVFVFLSSSFMTDVPFTTFTTLTLLCYVRAATRGEPRLLWWAGAWAYAAFLVRQVGIATPVAGLPLLFMAAIHPRLTRTHVAAALGVTWATMAITLLTLRSTLGTTSIMERWSWNIYARPDSYLDMNVPVLATLGFYLLPALLVAAAARRVWRRPLHLAAAGIATAVLLILAFGTIPTPLNAESTWTTQELGSSRLLLNGPLEPSELGWIDIAARVASWAAITLLLLFVVNGSARIIAALRHGGSALVRRTLTWGSARAPLVAFLGVYFVMMNLLWMWLDRYSQPLVPVLIALLLGAHAQRAASVRVAAVALAVFAAVGLFGTRDALRYNQAVRDVWQSLVDAGVPASDIDAGYAWNGWTLYAHPANLAPGLTPLNDVPWVTSGRKTTYVVAKAPIDGYKIEREVRWRELPWAEPNRLLVLKSATPANTGVATLSSP